MAPVCDQFHLWPLVPGLFSLCASHPSVQSVLLLPVGFMSVFVQGFFGFFLFLFFKCLSFYPVFFFANLSDISQKYCCVLLQYLFVLQTLKFEVY